MAKLFWLRLPEWDQDAALAAIEAGSDAIWPPDGAESAARRLGRVPLAGKGRELECETVSLSSAEDVEHAAKLAAAGKRVVVDCNDWRIIPWENLVGRGDLLALVRTAAEAEHALTALERGLAGVVLESVDTGEIRSVGRLVSNSEPSLELTAATITEIRTTGLGERTCVDAACLFRHGEGMLLGDRASALFLVAAETCENAFVPPRPFRVNAGGVHHYTLVPGGRTVYLSELKGGSEILAADASGRVRTAVVGRTKTERRPLVRVSADCNGKEASLILQNAETVCLVTPEGKPVSLAALETGAQVMVYASAAARHMGREVEEWIIER